MFHNIDLEQIKIVYEEIIQFLRDISKTSFEISCTNCENQTSIHWYNLVHVVKCEKCSCNVELSIKNKIIN